MSEPKDLAASYRKRARTLRGLAEMDRMGETSRTLMRIAQDYERMADDLDAIDRANGEARRA